MTYAEKQIVHGIARLIYMQTKLICLAIVNGDKAKLDITFGLESMDRHVGFLEGCMDHDEHTGNPSPPFDGPEMR